MKPKFPIEERKRLFLMHYSKFTFEDALAQARYLLKNLCSMPDCVFESLRTSIHVNYARPFMMNYGAGKLSDQIVPTQYLDIHKKLLASRNQFYAHSDATADGSELLFGKMHTVYCIMGDGLPRLGVVKPNCPPSFYESVIPLLEELCKKTFYHVTSDLGQI